MSAPPATRTVYVTVVVREGQPVPGLTPADSGLKEGGKEREIVSVEPAVEKMRIALMLDETLAAQGGLRAAMVEFVQRTCPMAEISLIVIGIRGETAVDFTSDPTRLINGIRNLSLNKHGRHSMVPEGVLEVARGHVPNHRRGHEAVGRALYRGHRAHGLYECRAAGRRQPVEPVSDHIHAARWREAVRSARRLPEAQGRDAQGPH